MEKRFILAIALSMGILLLWSTFVAKPQLVDNKVVMNKNAVVVPSPISPATSGTIITTVEDPVKLASLKFSHDSSDLIFAEKLAAITEVKFKKYQDYVFPLKYGLLFNDPTLSFNKESESSGQVTFVHNDPNKRITKKFIFGKSSYDIWLEITVKNQSAVPAKMNIPLVLGVLNFSNGMESGYQDFAVAGKDKTQHLNARKDQTFSEVEFMGLRNRYFCLIVQSDEAGSSGYSKKLGNLDGEVGIISQDFIVPPDRSIIRKYHIYLGPQDLHSINSIKPSWAAIINYGTFDLISEVLVSTLEFVHGIVHNWGWSIVILSFLVYFLLFPLSLKQMRSMKEMQLLQPKIEALRSANKDNPQKLNKEIMELYKMHKVNPLGGCLPLLLQMPIFFALYQALMRSVSLRGAKFLWIKDLAAPDRLFILPSNLPVFGNEINILPLLMALGMFVQQKISSVASTDSSTAEQQKMMLIIMPIMFGFIFYRMPSGLVLYWFINSSLMLVYQFRVNRAKK